MKIIVKIKRDEEYSGITEIRKNNIPMNSIQLISNNGETLTIPLDFIEHMETSIENKTLHVHIKFERTIIHDGASGFQLKDREIIIGKESRFGQRYLLSDITSIKVEE